MSAADGAVRFRAAGVCLLRGVAHGPLDVPAWPSPDTPLRAAEVLEWLRKVWAADEVAEAVGHASPVLARRVTDVLNAECAGTREAYRAAMSVARYVQRMMGRPAPFGLMSGVATASFGSAARVCWGNDRRVVAGAAAPWLDAVIGRLEACPLDFTHAILHPSGRANSRVPLASRCPSPGACT